MLRPTTLSKGDIMAMDRAYIDYEKFQQLTERGVIYDTNMKKNPGDAHYKTIAYGQAERAETPMEPLRACTMVRITLMYYIDFYSLFNNPEKEREIILSEAS